MKTNDEGDYIRKLMNEWSREENDVAKFNNKALHAILSSLDVSIFKVVMNCESTKEAWEILERYCQGAPKSKKNECQKEENDLHGGIHFDHHCRHFFYHISRS